MIHAQVQPTQDGALLVDAGLAQQPQAQWLDAAYWQALGRAHGVDGGRGGTLFVDTPLGACALRHYRRGGLMTRFTRDSYAWFGAERTRAFREFRLLAALADAGLPVPAPVAARYRRRGLRYRADLLTRRIEAVEPLAARMTAQRLDEALARAVGATLARFHARGVWHADLNASNILVGSDGTIWLLDFDRGRLRKPQLVWQRANLVRLRRSFDKLGARRIIGFDAGFWHPLLAAYHAAMASGGGGA
ncbi:MAG: 3-deoxy-D-manno-octulosonic acid kinase [Dokdonella sp.]|uniref:3-deoxy-D-manno-octulosonic acid kinase n=1 Tax=Dokdonella sp. TaxID=2291710 RepID=UPI0025C6CB7C|nr:3-deoxy-D-manno-octulosonic acid kinase [Dokdonella sp.]MBX3699967.1 3-deoxy-D-manno-octulosonic acid kinase [Dokdonella sp.]MCW5578584.1 3-deoxy-D-manno-octulosonic acid kinase [Dokdonella sp.]